MAQRVSSRRYTDRSKRVLALAAAEAARLYYSAVEPAHVFLGLVADESVSAQAPALSGLKLATARQTVESVVGRGSAREQLGALAPSAATRNILEAAAKAAEDAGGLIEPKHVLLAITLEAGSTNAVFQALGLSADAIRDQLLGASH
jgi:ATP-dependent Clp protease ATP-binding subunit ClpA